jgi:hypothetical protein
MENKAPQGGKQSQNKKPGPGQEVVESDPAFQGTSPTHVPKHHWLPYQIDSWDSQVSN